MIGWLRTNNCKGGPFPPLTRRHSTMPTSKRVYTRRHSRTHSFQDAGGTPVKVTTHNAGGEYISTRRWSVQTLLELGKGNFEEVERISVRKLTPQRIVEITRRYEEMGRPLILEDWHLREEWNKAILSADYLVEHLPNQGRHHLRSSNVVDL